MCISKCRLGGKCVQESANVSNIVCARKSILKKNNNHPFYKYTSKPVIMISPICPVFSVLSWQWAKTKVKDTVNKDALLVFSSKHSPASKILMELMLLWLLLFKWLCLFRFTLPYYKKTRACKQKTSWTHEELIYYKVLLSVILPN